MKLKLNMLLSNLANTFTKTSFPWVDPERSQGEERFGEGPVSTGELPAWGEESQGPHLGLEKSSIWTSKKPLIAINTPSFLY